MTRAVRSSGRREEIISAAADLFSRLGYHQTSMEDIAEAVGISKPTLYHYTKSKAEIVGWIHDKIADRMLASFEEIIAQGVEPHRRLWHVIHETICVMESEPGHLNVFFEHYRDLDKASRRVASRKREKYYRLVVTSIEEGIEAGTLRTDDPELSALALFGMTNWAFQWFKPGGGRSSEDIADHFWGLLVEGLGTEAVARQLT